MHPFFNVSGPISSLTLLRLINVLNENKTEPNSPDDANAKYEAFLKILVVCFVSAPLSRVLTRTTGVDHYHSSRELYETHEESWPHSQAVPSPGNDRRYALSLFGR